MKLIGYTGRPPAGDRYREALIADISMWLSEVVGIDGEATSASQGHVFVSYVTEDTAVVDRIQVDLEQAGIRVWRDRTNLGSGDRWKQAIRSAIKSELPSCSASLWRAASGGSRT